MQTQSITINFTGGIVSPGYLKNILEIAGEAHVSHVHLGLRQQLILDVPVNHFATFSSSCNQKSVEFYKTKEAFPNIVSSYPATGIFSNENWLREGTYKDIFSLFDHVPQLKINICDGRESFVPLFTGHINWISSSSQHFWYLSIRFPATKKVFHWPHLVYTNDIATLSRQIEKLIIHLPKTSFPDETTAGNALFEQVKEKGLYVGKTIDKAIGFPNFSLPYYEGFNKHDGNYWLGIYRRNQLFPVPFLMDLCEVSIQTRVGELYTTPWKSIIIKGIDPENRSLWDYILGKYRINVRHAENELNWQVEDDAEEGLQIKRHIIRFFDKQDLRTYGLCFAIQTRPSSAMYGSVIIRKQQNKNWHNLKSLERFDILYRADFNPNSGELIMYRQGVEKEHLGTYLVSLCKMLYTESSSSKIPDLRTLSTDTKQTEDAVSSKPLYQCSHCLTVYDEQLGDNDSNINAGTPFNELPLTYHCSLCEAGKEDFVLMK